MFDEENGALPHLVRLIEKYEAEMAHLENGKRRPDHNRLDEMRATSKWLIELINMWGPRRPY